MLLYLSKREQDMKFISKPLVGLIAALVAGTAAADIRITEVAPWASGNAPYAGDWFELTNTGSNDISISGWKVDDSSNSFASSIALAGISTIKAGESVIFIEGNASTAASFAAIWFGESVPAGFQIGTYTGKGIGFSTDGDAVNIFNGAGVKQAGVTFGVADGSTPYQSFDNAAGLDGVAISQLSVIGVNGAHIALNNINEIGSPGMIAAVPEPEQYAMLLAGLGLVGAIARRKQAK